MDFIKLKEIMFTKGRFSPLFKGELEGVYEIILYNITQKTPPNLPLIKGRDFPMDLLILVLN